MFSIYSITCNPTYQVYIGQTLGNPFLRFARHFSELKRGVHYNPKFQKVWNAYPSLIHWSCIVLEHIEGKRAVNLAEAKHVFNTPEQFRLNALNGLAHAIEKKDEVIGMLKEGAKYIEIRDMVGISLGTISKINQELKQTYYF